MFSITPSSGAHVGDLLMTGSSVLACVDRTGRPCALPDWLAGEIGEVVAKVAINRYPVPTAHLLRATIRDVMQVPETTTMALLGA